MATILKHPLIDSKITKIRAKDTSPSQFRRMVHEIAMLMVPYVTASLPTTLKQVETPMEKGEFPTLKKAIVLVPILRAGLGLCDGFHQLLPEASVAHIGMARDEETLKPHTYYCNLPSHISEATTIVLDPMLATGGSAIAAVDKLKEGEAREFIFVCLLAAPEGIQAFESAHPDVPVFCAAQDRELNHLAYILPGLGDAGDRIFGTV